MGGIICMAAIFASSSRNFSSICGFSVERQLYQHFWQQYTSQTSPTGDFAMVFISPCLQRGQFIPDASFFYKSLIG